MAEATDDSQASALGLISEEVLNNTVAQVSHTLQDEGATTQNLTSVTASDSEGNPEYNCEPLLSGKTVTLNGIASRFDSFERQSRVDRERVNKLCEQFSSEHVNKKGKQVKRTVNYKSNSDSLVQDVENAYRGTGARPKTLMRTPTLNLWWLHPLYLLMNNF